MGTCAAHSCSWFRAPGLGGDLVPVGCWELLRPTGSLPAPMAHGQFSMHSLHCTAVCKTITILFLCDSRMFHSEWPNRPPRQLSYSLSSLRGSLSCSTWLKSVPAPLLFLKSEQLSYSKCFDGWSAFWYSITFNAFPEEVTVLTNEACLSAE